VDSDSAVPGGGGVGGSCGDSGVGRGGADAGVRIVSTVVSVVSSISVSIPVLSLGGNSHHQQTGNLRIYRKTIKVNFQIIKMKYKMNYLPWTSL
jgi:hypothetical protein